MRGKQRNLNQRHQFAVAMALGQKVSVWAKKNGVPRQTCYDWRKTQEYKVTVEDVQRRTLNRAVGQFVRNLSPAVGRIVHLMTAAESESVQLHAARAVLKDLMAVREHVDLEERIVEIESRLQGANTHVP
jgi:transposase-like protein